MNPINHLDRWLQLSWWSRLVSNRTVGAFASWFPLSMCLVPKQICVCVLGEKNKYGIYLPDEWTKRLFFKSLSSCGHQKELDSSQWVQTSANTREFPKTHNYLWWPWTFTIQGHGFLTYLSLADVLVFVLGNSVVFAVDMCGWIYVMDPWISYKTTPWTPGVEFCLEMCPKRVTFSVLFWLSWNGL